MRARKTHSHFILIPIHFIIVVLFILLLLCILILVISAFIFCIRRASIVNFRVFLIDVLPVGQRLIMDVFLPGGFLAAIRRAASFPRWRLCTDSLVSRINFRFWVEVVLGLGVNGSRWITHRHSSRRKNKSQAQKMVFVESCKHASDVGRLLEEGRETLLPAMRGVGVRYSVCGKTLHWILFENVAL